jgi:benzylsuccinate CoA-transferase BbsF subunit
MKSFGLGYEEVCQLKPDIIYLSSPGFGGGGPYSNYKSYGPMLAATSGMLSIWAHPDDPYPVGSSAPLPDHMASKHLVVAALAALDYRRRTGEGQFIDMAQTEVAAGLIGESYLDYTINGRIQKPMGNRSRFAAPHNVYPCKGQDEWCAISVSTSDEWERFCEAIGNPHWTKKTEFADIVARLRNVDELDRLVGEWTASRTTGEVTETLQGAGLPAGVVQRVPDLLEDPQLKWLGAVIELDHPVVGKRLYPGIPFKMSGTPPLPSIRAPLLGEHTEEICRELLEMSTEEIESLKAEDVLQGI